jgi:hypothetical protein
MRATTRLFAVASLIALPEGAQTQRLVLLHGVNSDGGTWNELRTLLSGPGSPAPGLQILSPTITWTLPITQQGSTARSAMTGFGFGPSDIAMAHSNGGVVLREAVQQGQSMKVAMTVGSPLQGAPIGNDQNTVAGLQIAAIVGAANLDVAYRYSSWWGGPYIIRTAQNYAGELGVGGTALAGGGLLFALQSAAVRQDIMSGGAAVARHNSTLGPDLNASNRWPIVYQLSSNAGLLWKGLRPLPPHDMVNAEQNSQFLFPLMYEYFRDIYMDPPHPLEGWWEEGASLWLVASGANLSAAYWWCEAIGAASYPSCNGNDGFIPAQRQVWPGGTFGFVGSGGVRHMDETRDVNNLGFVVDQARQQ